MNNQTGQLIDGIDFSNSQLVSSTKNTHSTYILTPINSSLSTNTINVLKSKNQSLLLLEKIKYQAHNYVQSLKKLRSEINSLLSQYEHNLAQISEHPLYLLSQIISSSQLANLLADKIFIDSLSEKISEDLPPQDLEKSLAIKIESKPIVSDHDICEKIAKTTLLKAVIGLINQGNTSTHRSLITAAQTGQLRTFINKLVEKEKQIMRVLKADVQSLENDNQILQQIKRNVNQQLRQLRKQLKSIHQHYQQHHTSIDLIQKSNKISQSIQESQNSIYSTLSDVHLKLKGSIDLLCHYQHC